MSIVRLPHSLRPGYSYKPCALGVDLPAEFIRDLQGIDENLFPVWHAYRMLWDNIINDYAGPIEDPRYQITRDYGELNFGFVLTNARGVPTPDGSWHIWRLCRPHGWAHVINIDSTDTAYLNLLVKRLWLQAQYNDRYGNRGYSRIMEQLDLEKRERAQQERQDMMSEISKVNSAMLSRVASNFASGRVKPTNPTKDIIVSGQGINKRSRITRPISDKEGGLILPEDF